VRIGPVYRKQRLLGYDSRVDAFTHSLVGIALWRARLMPREAGFWGAMTLVAAANVPDAEGLFRLGGSAVYIRQYHGATHSLPGAAALGLAVAVLAAVGLQRARLPFRFPRLAALGLIGAASHLLLDLCQGYGERLLWPLSGARYGISLMASLDVANLAVLLLGLSIPLLLNAVNDEIHARRVDPRMGALLALAAVIALVPARYLLRTRADYGAAAALVQEEQSYSLHPSPFAPWRWYMVQDTGISYLSGEVDAIGQRALPGVRRFRKPLPNNVLLAVGDTEAGRAFLDLAVYPLFTLEQGGKGMLVRIRDMQFFIPGAGPRPYSLEVEINSELKVLRESVEF